MKLSDILLLIKGKRAAVGEIRNWKGGSYIKTPTGWKPHEKKYSPKYVERKNNAAGKKESDLKKRQSEVARLSGEIQGHKAAVEHHTKQGTKQDERQAKHHAIRAQVKQRRLDKHKEILENRHGVKEEVKESSSYPKSLMDHAKAKYDTALKEIEQAKAKLKEIDSSSGNSYQGLLKDVVKDKYQSVIDKNENLIKRISHTSKNPAEIAKEHPEYAEILKKKIDSNETISNNDFQYFPELGANYLEKLTNGKFYYDEDLRDGKYIGNIDGKKIRVDFKGNEFEFSLPGARPERATKDDLRSEIKHFIDKENSYQTQNELNAKNAEKKKVFDKLQKELTKKISMKELGDKFNPDRSIMTPKTPDEWDTAISKLENIKKEIISPKKQTPVKSPEAKANFEKWKADRQEEKPKETPVKQKELSQRNSFLKDRYEAGHSLSDIFKELKKDYQRDPATANAIFTDFIKSQKESGNQKLMNEFNGTSFIENIHDTPQYKEMLIRHGIDPSDPYKEKEQPKPKDVIQSGSRGATIAGQQYSKREVDILNSLDDIINRAKSPVVQDLLKKRQAAKIELPSKELGQPKLAAHESKFMELVKRNRSQADKQAGYPEERRKVEAETGVKIPREKAVEMTKHLKASFIWDIKKPSLIR